MKFMSLGLVLVTAFVLAAPSRAQQKPADAAPDSAIAYRVQVVVAEYDGATKISSLPYTVPLAVSGDPRAQGSVRVGIRVPINGSAKSGESAIQYLDIGTNLDLRVKRVDNERYELELTLDRSSLHVREENKEGRVEGRAWVPGDSVPDLAPVLQQLRFNEKLLLRDGRPGETASITDPVTGHVLRVDAVLTVLK